MTWSDFYLICFAVGFCFSFFSFVFGGWRFGRVHVPHLHHHPLGHIHVAHGPVAHAPAVGTHAAPHAPVAGHGDGATHGSHGTGVSPFNPPSIAAFLAWFGGTGYLLTRFSARACARVGCDRRSRRRRNHFLFPDEDSYVRPGISRSRGFRDGGCARQAFRSHS